MALRQKGTQFNRFTNGIGVSEWEQNAFYTLVSIDIHSKPGVAMNSLEMTRADSSIVDAEILCRAVVPNGDTFMGASNGKIFKVTSAGVVTLVHTSTQSVVYGIDYLDGYLYYASATKLGRIALANASSEASWSSQNDTWATFSIWSTYKAMMRQNLSLFITDGYYIASVDNTGAFSANVLDLETNQVATALHAWKIYLVIGTTKGTASAKAGIFVWDCFAPSWSDFDEINERGVNCFIDGDNVFYISIGLVGNIYYWDGTQAVFFQRLTDAGNIVVTGICPYASGNLNGLPLFATSRGIYSLGRAKSNLPVAQVIEYAQSQGQGTESVALAIVGNQVFVGCKNGSNYQIDKLSTGYAVGMIITPVALGKTTMMKVKYSSMPADGSITATMKIDNADFASRTLVKDDTDERCYKVAGDIQSKTMVLAKLLLNPSVDKTETPEIYDIEFS